MLMLCVGVLLLTSCHLPPIDGGPDPHLSACRSCATNIHEIINAIHKYESANGTLPPAFTVDADGNRLHSWRSLILPYLDENELYEMIDFSKPWDHSSNRIASEKIVDVYLCPSAPLEGGQTTYLGVYGPDCCFAGSVPRRFSEITDGRDKTAIICNVNFERAVHWMSPHDASVESILEYSLDSQMQYFDAFGVGFCDSSVRWVPLHLEEKETRALLTIAGGEAVNFDWKKESGQGQ